MGEIGHPRTRLGEPHAHGENPSSGSYSLRKCHEGVISLLGSSPNNTTRSQEDSQSLPRVALWVSAHG